jgi:type I restriction enzyme M protein
MFVQSEEFVEAHGGQRTDVSTFGQESNPTTWRLAHMNSHSTASRSSR